MRFPIDLSTWRDDPVGVVDAAFAPDGPMASAMPGYVRNDKQVAYARILARAAVRGMNPEKAGFTTPVEGSTGLGKSLAILLVSGIHAVLTGRRAVTTTFTRALNRQLAGSDARVAVAVVEALTGRRPRIAVRRSRSSFASPSQCLDQAAYVRREAASAPEGEREPLLETADALERLGAWTSEQLGLLVRADGKPRSLPELARVVAGFGGLIETFVAQNEDCKIPLSRFPYDLYTISGRSEPKENSLYDLYREVSGGADVLIATHAALVRDQSLSGRMLDDSGEGFSLIVVDEGNRLEEAGVLALGTRRALSSFRREREIVMPFVSEMKDKDDRIDIAKRLDDLLEKQQEDGDRMMVLLSGIAHGQGRGFRREIEVVDGEPWLEILRRIHDRSARIVETLRTVDDPVLAGLVKRLSNRHRDMETFLDCIRRTTATAAHSGTGRPSRDDYAFATPLLTFSPLVGEPSVMTKPKHGARILSRLWSSDVPRADAIVVTSATLGMSTTPGESSFSTILRSIGLDITSPRVNRDLAGTVEMDRFGVMRKLVLPHPSTPLPNIPKKDRVFEDDHRDPAWVAYVADGIVAAWREVWRGDARNRVVVLSNSFAEAEVLGEAVRERIGDALIVRSRHDGVDEGFDRLSTMDVGVLITTGAYDGIDRPGLIDHLVVPRLPFPASDDAYYQQYRDEQGRMHWSRHHERMLMILKQAIGRPFRKVDDEACVWIMDPRIGVPRSSYHGRNPAADSTYLGAIPKRFRRQVEKATILSVDQARKLAA